MYTHIYIYIYIHTHYAHMTYTRERNVRGQPLFAACPTPLPSLRDASEALAGGETIMDIHQMGVQSEGGAVDGGSII